jgi:hypothetical protein
VIATGSATAVASGRSSGSWLSVDSSQWIRGPVYDVIFFCALWWVPVSVLILGTTTAMASALFFILYHLFIRVPHFAATANFTYLYQANRAYYREHWFRYLAMPVVIVAAYAARPWFDSRSLYNNVLLSIATIWGMQHIAAQNFGVLSLYRGRSAAKADGRLRSIEKAVFYELMALAVFESVLRLWWPVPNSVIRAGYWAIRLAVVLTCVAYVARIWARRSITPVSIPALLYFATAVSVMVPWPVYKRMPIPGAGAFFYVFNGQHCLAYLGLVFHMTSNRQRRGQPFTSWLEGSTSFARFYSKVAIGAIALCAVAGYVWFYRALPFDVNSGYQALTVLDGVFVAHYYLESNTWRFSNPHNRAVVLPLLKGLAPA